MNENIEDAMNRLIEAIRESEVYREYEVQLTRVKQLPELKAQIDEFRARNYQLQFNSENALDRIDQFEREYEDFRENPIVSDFLAAELAFCRMMQDISGYITMEMNFE